MARCRRRLTRDQKLVLSAVAVGLLLVSGSSHRAATAGHAAGALTAKVVAGGTLNCSGLERLWEQAGGPPAAATLAASVATAESSGNQYASSPAGDVGYWQINAPIWGSLATTDPLGNARAAVQISHDGSDWTPWVTYDTGAYAGLC
jgi:hypothetical protein